MAVYKALGKRMTLNQITLPVTDMTAAVDFYLRMGFMQIVDTPHYARFESQVGEATFSLQLETEIFSNGATLYFEIDDVDSKVRELQLLGLELEQLPTDHSYLWREAVIHDPSGNRIKLYHAGENRLHPPWRVERTYQRGINASREGLSKAPTNLTSVNTGD